MVYTGKPSGACDACRRRRIKCNEARPACSYCSKKKIPCLMARSQFDIAWRDQNATASRAVQRRLNAGTDRLGGVKITRLEITKPSAREVPRVLAQDYEGYALDFFFTSYVPPPKDSNYQRGYLDCLWPVWTQIGRKSSPLKPALNAVALALLEAWSLLNPNSVQSLARAHYIQGVAAIRQHLQRAEEVDDDVLMATLLLDMYDGIMSFCGARSHSGPHLTGSAALIEHRRKLPFNNETSQRIVLAIRNQIVGKALIKGETVSADVLKWTAGTLEIPTTPGLELSEIEVQLTSIRAAATRLARDNTADKASTAAETLAKAIELDQQLVAWSDTIPPDWVPACIWDPECIPQTVRDAGCYKPYCTVHKDVFTADLLNRHCTTRIKVQLVIMSCLELLDDTSQNPARISARETVQDLADTICASVPFLLGDRTTILRIDDMTVQYPRVRNIPTPTEHYHTAAAHAGYLLMRRLAELLGLGLLLRYGQREWILGQMQRIKRIYLAHAT